MSIGFGFRIDLGSLAFIDCILKKVSEFVLEEDDNSDEEADPENAVKIDEFPCRYLILGKDFQTTGDPGTLIILADT